MKTSSALELACPPIHTVKIGLIGLGQRGIKTLIRYTDIPGAEIRYLADLDVEHIKKAQSLLRQKGYQEVRTFVGPNAWKQLCEIPDIDVIYICTDWNSHCAIALAAMYAGKHVAIEVPAATSVSECWQLVHAAETYRRHCFMTENCCYDYFSLALQNIADNGLLGEITHCEGAYIHNLRDYLGLQGQHAGPSNWMEQGYARHTGNPYPTHGLGPIAWLLNIHRGDRFDYLVSMSSSGKGTDQLIGRINTTLIHTKNGRSIMLQHDITTHRPYSRLQTICGTEGYAQKYPLPTIKIKDTPAILQGDNALNVIRKHMSSSAAKFWEEGHQKGVTNEMNYAMDRRFIYCLQNGLPLDIDVYDAAEWSCITELSMRSVENGSIPVAIPDFTQGLWTEIKKHQLYS